MARTNAAPVLKVHAHAMLRSALLQRTVAVALKDDFLTEHEAVEIVKACDQKIAICRALKAVVRQAVRHSTDGSGPVAPSLKSV